jgi:hypothetical protein
MIILRVDVDLPSKFSEKMEFCPYPSLVPLLHNHAYYNKGYYGNVVNFANLLKDHDVDATFFLPDFFYPPTELKHKLSCFDLGVHVSKPDLLLETRKALSRDFDREIDKFSAHDISVFKPNEQRFIGLVKEGRFKIFSGNREPSNVSFRKVGDGYYFPSIFYTRKSPVIFTHDFSKFTTQWLLKHEKDGVIVVCTHPCELEGRLDGTVKTRSTLEKIFESCQVKSFEGWLSEYD